MMESIKIYGALLTTLLFWASAFVGIRVGLTAYSPGSLALLRFLVASVFMLVIYIYLPAKKIEWMDRWQLMLIGVAGIGIYNISLNYGELSVSAGVASFIIGLMPVITLILSVVFLKERPNSLVWLGIAVSLFGLGCIIFGEEAQINATNGVLIILIATVMGGIYSVTQRRYLRHYHPVAITAWVMWGGTLMLLIFVPELWHEIKVAPFPATFSAVYMGIFPAAVAYVAWCYVLKHWPASKASMYLYAMPVFSTLLGFLLLNEQPSFLSIAGGLLALLGAVIANHFQTIRLLYPAAVPGVKQSVGGEGEGA